MRYQGGKTRIAAQIAPFIIAEGGECFVSLFCGSCAIESKVAPHFKRVILNDVHEYLIALLKGIQSGYDPPDEITEAQYRFIRNNKDLNPALTGFAGFGCSFGGRFFEGYARSADHTNFAAQSKKSVLWDMQTLKAAEIFCGDYRDVHIPPGAVIYADPPYYGTKGYREKFDHDAFWTAMRLLAETGHKVFISEQQAPQGFNCVWEKPFTRTLDRNKENQFKVIEKLFTYDWRNYES